MKNIDDKIEYELNDFIYLYEDGKVYSIQSIKDEFVIIGNAKSLRGICTIDCNYSFRPATDDESLTFK